MAVKKRFAEHTPVWKEIERINVRLRELPAQATLIDLLATPEGVETFAGAVQRYCEEQRLEPLPKNVVSYEQRGPRLNGGLIVQLQTSGQFPIPLFPNISNATDKVRWFPVIWATLMGAALALAILSICNPAAFHRPTQGGMALAPTSGGAATLVYGIPAADKTPNPTNSDTVTMRAPTAADYIVSLNVDRDCWISVTDASGHEWTSRNVKAGFHQELGFAKAELWPVTIRSGCPGSIYYAVNGTPAHPDNLSKTPEKSEVVKLP